MMPAVEMFSSAALHLSAVGKNVAGPCRRSGASLLILVHRLGPPESFEHTNKGISISKQHVVQRMLWHPGSHEIFSVYYVPKAINISIGRFSKRVTVSRPMTTRWQGWTGWGVKEVTMRSLSKLLAILCLVIFPGSFCCGATITGTVKGPDGSPFPGAFVEAQNTKTKMTVMSLSDDQGHYQVEKLPAGEYRVQVRAVGYRSNPQTGLNLTAEQNATLDIALQKGTVHWNDLSIYQAGKLWPASTGKDLIVAHCYVCHGFQTRMASVTRDEDGWRDRVQYMRDAMHFSLSWRFTDHDAADVASYLN